MPRDPGRAGCVHSNLGGKGWKPHLCWVQLSCVVTMICISVCSLEIQIQRQIQIQTNQTWEEKVGSNIYVGSSYPAWSL